MFQIKGCRVFLALVALVSIFASACGGGGGGGGNNAPPPPPPLSSDATLSALSFTGLELDTAFDAADLEYFSTVSVTVTSTIVTFATTDSNATVTVNGTSVASGAASDPISLDTLFPGSNLVTIAVTAENGTTTNTYTVDITRLTTLHAGQDAYLKASNTGSADQLGAALGISEDGSTLAVGAFGENSAAIGVNGDQADDSANDSGAVYVYTRDSGGVWTQQAYVKASNTEAGDHFGDGVSLSADGATLAVGAPEEDSAAAGVDGDQADNSAERAGAVYVFTRDTGGVWTQQAYVKASNPETDDFFGAEVSLSGDGATLAVTAVGEDSAATGVNGDQADNSALEAGAVYVFTRGTGGVWTQQAYVKASNPGLEDRFGYVVSLSGDGATLAVGAPLENSGATGVDGDQADNSVGDAGAVYVFTRDSVGVWTQRAYVKASNTGENDAFGESIGLSGDGTTLAVGAGGESSAATGVNGDQADNSAAGAGAVYVFTRDTGGVWTQQAYLKASNTDGGDRFGSSLGAFDISAGTISLSADGATLAVGAPSENSGATGVDGDQADNSAGDAGAVYVFTRDSVGVWTQRAYVKASNTGVLDHFGESIGLSGDGTTLAVGAVYEGSAATGLNGDEADDSAGLAGAAYVFR